MQAPRSDMVAAYLLAGIGLWLSYVALADLARRSGIGEPEAYAWPLIVDGLILLATRAVFTSSEHPSARRYAWSLLIFGAGISIIGNAVHMLLPAGPVHPAIAVGVGIAPPVVTLAVTHLVMVRARVERELRAAAEPHPDAAVEPQPDTAPAALPQPTAAPVAPTRHTQVNPTAAPIDLPAPVPLLPRPTEPEPHHVDLPAPHGPADDTKRGRAITLLAAGKSARAVGRELGISDRTVRRWKTDHDTLALAAS